MPLTKEQLHDVLVDTGGVTEEDFEKASASKEAAHIGIDGVLVANGQLTDAQLGQLMGMYYDVPFVSLRQQEISSELVQLLPESFSRKHELLPVTGTEDEVTIATTSPDDVVKRSLIEKYLRKGVKFVYATRRDILSNMYLFKKNPQDTFDDILKSVVEPDATLDTRIIDLVNEIINHGYQGGASDIHIEPEDEYTAIRFRQDGVLHDVAKLPVGQHEQILTRLKVVSRLATDEHRAAQDGKIRHKTPWGDEVEIRLSILPTTHAEKAVMRLLSDQTRTFSLADLGLASEDYKKVDEVIHSPWGMILVTGPTGSGKTTTLYSVLKLLNDREVNITTIEDPVEYDIEGVNQIQVNEKTGLTFAKGLRSIVRQDPDIVMVGEIRDKETAGIAVNAAMTGHLVLSTLHTNDAATAFPRFTDMDAEDFLIASTVNVVIAQRLVRKTCMNCIQSVKLSAVEQKLIDRIPNMKEYLEELAGKKAVKDLQFFEGKGCHVCHMSGFHGRVGVFEVLVVSDAIRDAIMQHKNADEIRNIAISEGMTTMLYDGLRKVTTGQTTVQEVLRVTRE